MRDSNEEDVSTHTVGSSSKEERRPRSRWSKTGGNWQKGVRVEDHDEVVQARWSFNAGALPYEPEEDDDGDVKAEARWSFNAGAVSSSSPDNLEDGNESFIGGARPYEAEEDEEDLKTEAKARWSFNAGAVSSSPIDDSDDENDVWLSPTGTAKNSVSMIEEEDQNISLNDTADQDASERSFGEPSPITPRKIRTLKGEKMESPSRRRYIPNPPVPKTPTQTSKTDDDDYPSPKRVYNELCGENCEKEFRLLTKEAHSLSPGSRRPPPAPIDVSKSLTLSAAHRKRPSVRGVIKKQKVKSMERRDSIRESLAESLASLEF
ncbi:unnamed protein product [Cylindrotheca closterium]|uniref:Uncharacterized protein n=1 Tax=Cylindrotheca closterium TaxID=2856 RepID=A0AAD2FLI9_9STRA|nr:unnamed protein product [Cylindrotheca closterium]